MLNEALMTTPVGLSASILASVILLSSVLAGSSLGSQCIFENGNILTVCDKSHQELSARSLLQTTSLSFMQGRSARGLCDSDLCDDFLSTTSRTCRAERKPFSITNITNDRFQTENDPCKGSFPDGFFENTFNVSYPGLKVLHAACQIYFVEDFLPEKTRRDLISSASDEHLSVGLIQLDAHGEGVSATGNNRLMSGNSHRACTDLLHESTSFWLCGDCHHKRQSTQHCPRSSSAILETNEKIRMILPRFSDAEREPLVLTKYGVGDYYTAHLDMRPVTVLLYLGGNATGGATFFPKLNLRVVPKPGSALIFFPGRKDSHVDESVEDLLHSAEDVLAGEKWVGQIWIGYTGWKIDQCN